jgi:hypothetical protein
MSTVVLSLAEKEPAMRTMRATCAVLAAMVAASWSWTLPAAEEDGKKLVTVLVTLEQFTPNTSRSWTLPNGKTIGSGCSGMSREFICDASEVEKTVKEAKRRHAEMKELIAQKKSYRLLKVYGEENTGGKLYKYRFTFSDGSQDVEEFSIPLDNVTSWDDFLQKRQAEEDQRNEKIYRAIVAGRYRLKHTSTRYSFVCQDADSTEKYRVMFIPGPKGKHKATILPFEEKNEEQAKGEEQVAVQMRTTSWQDHLQAVREGKRKVLRQEIKKTYYYEILLDDGSRTMLPSGEPL